MMPKPEWKYIDTAVFGTITTTATVFPLTAISQGDTDTSRTGDKVTLKSFLMRLNITPNATAGINFLRILALIDKQNNAVAPTAAQILQNSTTTYSPLNDDWGKRFKVFYDRTFTVDTDATGGQVEKTYRKLRNVVIEYPGTGTVPNTNGVYILMLADQPTDGPAVIGTVRIRYTDP